MLQIAIAFISVSCSICCNDARIFVAVLSVSFTCHFYVKLIYVTCAILVTLIEIK